MSFALLGVRLSTQTITTTTQQIDRWLADHPKTPKIVYTPNPEILVYAYHHPDYLTILNQADLTLPDGIGVVWLSQGNIPERITGTDILKKIVEKSNNQDYSIGVVLRKTGLSQPSDLPGMIVTHDRFETVPDVVVVALGFPEQEQWVHDHLAALAGCRLVMTVGGGIDFLTGKQRRAPLLFRRLGLEWLWRLFHQPWRWRRIVTATIIFPYLVLKQRWFHA
ncbi:MAG: hypothetical protein ACD_41C00257G0009 [uncultured bacterium]|nr:MAG: hypothetical protein ACD_41C00257G0009 [uncultured bacterium]HBY74108.1 hypothetical protein [Candidatus Kerfeldbacteria bacterium]